MVANEVMSDSYCEALAYIITTQTQSLGDKNKAGAFIALFLQSINNKYGETGLKRVIVGMKKELTPETIQKSGNEQSSVLKRLRNKLLKRRQRQANPH
ncbi:MAG: hypothetical protein HQK99_02705 [Nitrospirae bacterium]|nr:hypothetical protein [Nitrospirota bacterium]